MAALLFKLKLFNRPDADGSMDDSFADDLESLRELGAAELLTGPIPQQDGTVAQLMLFAIPALTAGEVSVHETTYLTTEVVAVRWYPGSFESLPEDLRVAWDASRE